MQTAWKFQLPYATPHLSQSIPMPMGADIVHFDVVDDVPTIWAVLNPHNIIQEMREFTLYGTGVDIPDHAEHVGTWIDGQCVWHLFEVTRR